MHLRERNSLRAQALTLCRGAAVSALREDEMRSTEDENTPKARAAGGRARILAELFGASLVVLGLAAGAQAADQPAAPASSQPSQAAQPPQSSGSEQDREEIVVTSTLIRGKAPVGSNVISAGQDKLQAFAAAT